MPRMILCHRKTAKDEGRSAFIALGWTVVGLAVLVAVISPIFWQQWLDRLFLIAFSGCTALIAGMLWSYAWVHFRSSGTFVCSLTEQEFRWHIPVAGCGEDFAVAVRKIEHLERELDEGTPKWFVCHTGERREIPPNYDNPAGDFVDALRQLRPDLKIVEKR